jgi:redox-sensitive bicupin YhaK (pirin superfamily)
VNVYVARLAAGSQIEHALAAGRYAWLQVARGSLEVNGKALQQGDAAAISAETALRLSSSEDSEALLFDLA